MVITSLSGLLVISACQDHYNLPRWNKYFFNITKGNPRTHHMEVLYWVGITYLLIVQCIISNLANRYQRSTNFLYQIIKSKKVHKKKGPTKFSVKKWRNFNLHKNYLNILKVLYVNYLRARTNKTLNCWIYYFKSR